MLDASFKFVPTGYIGFSLLLHSGLIFLLATLPNWREVPLETTDWVEIGITSKAPLKRNTSQPVLTSLPPPRPATEADPKTPEPSRHVRAVVVAKPKATSKKKAAKTKKKKQPKKVAKKTLPPPPQLPEKNEPEPWLEPKVQKMSPVVVVKQDTPPLPSKVESLEESDIYQEFQKDQDNKGAVADSKLIEEINREVEEIESEARLIAAANPHWTDEENPSDPPDPFENLDQQTKAKSLAPVARQERAEPLLTSHKKNAIRPLPPTKGGSAQAADGRRPGIPSGARLNTDLRQHPGNVPPIYPAVARQSSWEGTVALSYQVTAAGRVQGVRVARSSGYDMLDREAVRAIRRYRYLPGQQGKTYHPVTFRLTGPAQQNSSRLHTSRSSLRRSKTNFTSR